MSLEGTVARVSAPITANSAGEVMASIAGGSQAFEARSYDEETEFSEGDRVYIVEQTGRVLYVADIIH